MIYIKKFNKSIEEIITQVSKKILEDTMVGPVSKQGLQQWNNTQIYLMKDLNKMGKLDLSDPQAIYDFGQKFADYVYSHDMESPTPIEMMKLLRL
jgi:hypothetical protein